MKKFSELKALFDLQLSNKQFPDHPKNLYDPIRYILEIGGKRIRPTLMLMSHQLFSKDIERSFDLAIAIEVFHNFTLLHDDIMDNSSLRRGLPTVHEKWTQSSAILSGDAMLIYCYTIINNSDVKPFKEILNVFNQASIKICEGQQLDLDFAASQIIQVEDYLRMIEYKTAVLLAASLKIGALNAGASQVESDHMYNFGINLGIAFQLKDDLLDIYGDSLKFGKELGGDIISNKKTYLFLKSIQDSNFKQREILNKCYSNHSNQSNKEKIKIVKEIFEELNIYEKTTRLIIDYNNLALDHLSSIQSSYKEPFLELTKSLLKREN